MICNAMLLGSAAADNPSARPMYAPEPPTRPFDRTVEVEEWYGWKIALADATSVALVLTSFALDTPERDDPSESFTIPISAVPAIVGVGGYFTITPFLHLTELNVKGVVLSYGARLVLPSIGAILGSQLDGPASSEDPYASAGVLIGMVAASALDIAVFSRRTRVHEGAGWLPRVAVNSEGVELGVAGAF